MRLCLLSRRLALVLSALVALGTLAASPAAAAELLIDNTDPTVQVKGNWSVTSTTSGFQGTNYLFRTRGDGSAFVRWPFQDGWAAGRYEVFTRWSAGPNRASNAIFQVTHAGGAASVSVDQKTNGGTWQSLGTFEFQPGKGQGVLISDKADGVVVADAIRLVGPQATTAASTAPTATQATARVAPTPTPSPVPTARPASPAPPPPPPAAPPAPAVPRDARYFEATRYRIGEDAFWDFFQKRGGTGTLGYPVSNVFTLSGLKVQMFQRQVLQLRQDGGVQTMNILDQGLMPYTNVNGSVFPAPDANVTSQAPSPSDPDYHAKALQFVRDMAPNQWDGQNVNFAKTFFSSVRAEDAFPGGAPPGSDGLLAGFNLEIWGLPISRPAYDPGNKNFIYQRFQRGIMHYDKTCDCTQGLLLADYLKAITTTRNLPADLAQQAKGSPLFGQWAPTMPLGLTRPNDLPGSNFVGAFRRDPLVTVDAGHGAREIGTSATYPDGASTREKDLNLRVATRLRDLLQQAGYEVVTTRTADTGVNADGKDLTGDGKATLSDDLQARVDVANRARADVLVSVHFNGISDPAFKGTYTFYNPNRPFADRNKALADMVQANLVRSLREAGYNTLDRGARTDGSVLGGGQYFILGAKSDVVARPSGMPGIIGEPLFLTNTDDASAVRNDKVVEAIARGYLDGIKAYFAKYPPG